MTKLSDIEAKVDLLQQKIDAEQLQIQAALDKLNQTIADLQVIIEDGGTEQQRQAISDKIDLAIADLESTVTEEVPE